MIFDYSKLRGRIREVFGTQQAFAEALGISTTSLSQKLNNKSEFTQNEIRKSVEILNVEKENRTSYFFTLKVREVEHVEEIEPVEEVEGCDQNE